MERAQSTSAISGWDWDLQWPDDRRTFLRRFQRRFHRPCFPGGAVGGPIALVEEGDRISIDIDNHALNLLVSDEELAARKAKWQPREPKVTSGYLARYASLVTSADKGAVLQVK